MDNAFFLITEPSFHASYLVTEWITSFETLSDFGGIALREDPSSKELSTLRDRLHQEFKGCHFLTPTGIEQFRKVYPHFNETDIAMIKLFGVPTYSVSSYPGTVFLSENLNSRYAWEWLSRVVKMSAEPPVFFIFLDQLLKSWWIEMTHSHILNGHSAILPYARGMYAIENIAMTQNSNLFLKSAGASVHYIDTGIDTGPLITTEHLARPFSYDSIWEVKAASFKKVFTLITRTALSMLETHSLPVGESFEDLQHGPSFNRRNFTEEARKKAEEGYLRMKESVKDSSRLSLYSRRIKYV